MRTRRRARRRSRPRRDRADRPSRACDVLNRLPLHLLLSLARAEPAPSVIRRRRAERAARGSRPAPCGGQEPPGARAWAGRQARAAAATRTASSAPTTWRYERETRTITNEAAARASDGDEPGIEAERKPLALRGADDRLRRLLDDEQPVGPERDRDDAIAGRRRVDARSRGRARARRAGRARRAAPSARGRRARAWRGARRRPRRTRDSRAPDRRGRTSGRRRRARRARTGARARLSSRSRGGVPTSQPSPGG